MRIVEMVRDDIKNSSLLKTKFLIYAFNGRTKSKPLSVFHKRDIADSRLGLKAQLAET